MYNHIVVSFIPIQTGLRILDSFIKKGSRNLLEIVARAARLHIAPIQAVQVTSTSSSLFIESVYKGCAFFCCCYILKEQNPIRPFEYLLHAYIPLSDDHLTTKRLIHMHLKKESG